MQEQQHHLGGHMAATDLVELRGNVPRETIDILDAVSLGRRPSMSRIDLVNEILAEWCGEQAHIAMLVVKATGGNPQLMEARGR